MIAYTRLRDGAIRRERDRATIPPDADTLDAREFRAAVAADPSCVADEPAPPMTEAAAIAAIQQRLDAQAKAWGYDSALSAASYATSNRSRFRAEGEAIRDWRDATWERGYEILAQAQAGQIAVSSIPELLALLPAAPDRPSA